MIKADMHTHSHYSFDVPESEETKISAIFAEAESKDIAFLALTDHYDICGETPFVDCSGLEIEKQQNEFAKARENTSICALYGIELGGQCHYPKHSEYILKNYKFDFIISSIHNLYEYEDFALFNYEKLSKEELKDCFDKYLGELLELSENYDFDTLAHTTYPLRYFRKGKNNPITDISQWFEKYERIFSNLIKRGVSLEINTAKVALGQGFSPDSELLKLYISMGGREFTVGSDCHKRGTLFSGCESAYEFLRQNGIYEINIYKERKKERISII